MIGWLQRIFGCRSKVGSVGGQRGQVVLANPNRKAVEETRPTAQFETLSPASDTQGHTVVWQTEDSVPSAAP